MHQKPALTADNVILRINASGGLDVLLIKRKHTPFEGMWALPGGFVDENETAESAAKRELQEETGITGLKPMFFGFYSTPGRDPRGWTVTSAFVTLVYQDISVKAGDDAAEVCWFKTNELPQLAFDHKEIILDALNKIKDSLVSIQKNSGILDLSFTLKELNLIDLSQIT